MTYTTEVSKNSSVINTPSWLTFNDASATYTIAMIDYETPGSPIGTYLVSTTAASGGFTATTSFEITVWSDCVTSVISPVNTPAVADMNTEVGGIATTQILQFTNSVAEGHSDPTYCGPFLYVLNPTNPALLSITGDTITLSTNDPGQTGGPNIAGLIA